MSTYREQVGLNLRFDASPATGGLASAREYSPQAGHP